MNTCDRIAAEVVLVFDSFNELWPLLPRECGGTLAVGDLSVRYDYRGRWVEQEIVESVAVRWWRQARSSTLRWEYVPGVSALLIIVSWLIQARAVPNG